MAETTSGDPMESLLIRKLHGLLVSECQIDGVNLLVCQQDDYVVLSIMAVSVSSLGMLLAALADPAELDDLSSLSRRITPGDEHGTPGEWKYELTATRYPADRAIVFAAKVRLPVTDLPEIGARLGRLG